MYNLAQSIIFLFIAGNRVSASRWWRDTGYDGDLLDDSPEPTATLPPKAPYQHYLSAGTSPLNATLGDGIYHLLAARQLVGCRLCAQPNPVCCNNGTFCCASSSVCQDAGWCCPEGLQACPGAPNVCRAASQTCCSSGVCERGSICCGESCCNTSNSTCTANGQCLSLQDQASISSVSLQSLESLASLASQSRSSSGEGSSTVDPPSSSSSETSSTSVVVDPPVLPSSSSSSTETTVAVDPPQTSSVSISDSPQVVPFEETATLDIPSSSFVELPSDPVVDSPSASIDPLATIVDPEPSDPIDSPVDPQPSDSNPPAAVDPPAQDADTPPSSSSIVVETSVSSGVTLTVSRTVAPQVLTGTAPTNTVTNAAQEDAADAVALVYPWDPRIQYDPESSWVSTTSSSSVGTCHNGTKVASQAGASIKFAFEGKQISVLTCQGSKSGDYRGSIDGAPGVNVNGYKDPGPSGDECIISQTFNSGMLADGNHNISIIVKGASSSQLSGGTAVEFGGFIYRGPNAYGTATESKNNIPAIIGGTVGGVIGVILILTLIVVTIIRRKRRNRREDDAPAVHTIPVVTSGTPYSAVPTTEYHDPYATSGYGPNYYPNPTATPSTQPLPAWRQTDAGPFGDGSYVSSAR